MKTKKKIRNKELEKEEKEKCACRAERRGGGGVGGKHAGANTTLYNACIGGERGERRRSQGSLVGLSPYLPAFPPPLSL